MTDKLPAPLAPSNLDVRDVDAFMVSSDEITSSEFAATSSAEEFKAAIVLRAKAWKQVPAGSLPDDDRALAAFAGLTLAKWRKAKARAMHGFLKCSDGRLYHAELVADAKRAAANKQKGRLKREADAQRLREWRNAKRGNKDETRFNGVSEAFPETPETHDVASIPVPVPTSSSSSPLSPGSPRAELMAKVWKAVGVPDGSAMPPRLVDGLFDLVQSLETEGCEFDADIAPALRARPQDAAWPGSVAFWRKIARSNRDRRAASAPPARHVEIGIWRERLDVWHGNHVWSPAWGPKPGEVGCIVPSALLNGAAA